MPLLPEIARMIDAAVAAGRPAISAGSPEDARRMVAEMRPVLGAGPELARVEAVTVPGRGGAIPARLYCGGGRPAGLVVYLHGGGWVLGTLEDYDAVARVLAARSGCALLLVDYRLAPEAQFPAAVEDCVDAVRWAAREGVAMLGGGLPLVVAGDSAGGNLATVVAAELRGVVPIAGQVLIYPVTDGDLDTASYLELGGPGLLTREDMAWFFRLYAPGHHPTGSVRGDARLHPAARGDLAGLPPAHVVTAEVDVLRDEGEGYAARLAAAGVPVTRKRYEGLPHAFIRMHNVSPASDAAVTEIAEAMGRACRAGEAAA